MFIRFVGGEIDAQSHVEEGLFCAASKLQFRPEVPEYQLDRLWDLLWWFTVNLSCPFHYRLRQPWRSDRAICWFKPSAREHLAKAFEMVSLLEENDLLVKVIKAERIGYRLYEDEAQVLAQPFFDIRVR
jgi:hypothetical protein